MIISIKLYLINGRDDKYLEMIKRIIKEVMDEQRISNYVIRFISVRIDRDYLDIIRGMLLGGEGPAEFMPIVNELREYKVFDLPVLIINNKKVFEGRELNPAEIRQLILNRIRELLHT